LGRLFHRKESDSAGILRFAIKHQQRQRDRQNTWRRGRSQMLIALQYASPDFSRKLAGMQVVCYGYCGQKNRRQHGERDNVRAYSVKERALARAAAASKPQSPKGDCNRQPSEIG
jgi:hypothetical protein